MRIARSQQMFNAMRPGEIYRQADLQRDWPNASHDLNLLVENNKVRKVSAGLYYRPQMTKYGVIAPNDNELVEKFLRDKDFLVLDVNQYTSLVGGLTQLAMGKKVINRRRHGHFSLAGYPFDFRVRRNFPKKATKSFLLVDLLDNVKQTEDGVSIKEKVLSQLSQYNRKELLKNAKLYGNKSTVLFLEEALGK